MGDLCRGAAPESTESTRAELMYPRRVDPQRREILRRVRAFADLADDECDAVLAVLKARRGAPGDALFKEGDRGDSLTIVLDGHLVASVRTQDGSHEEVARLGPGEVVGEMAFVDAEPRSATVTAPDGATVLEFSREALAGLRRSRRVSPRRSSATSSSTSHVASATRARSSPTRRAEAAPGTRAATASAGPASMRRPSRGLTVEQLRGVPALASYGAEDSSSCSRTSRASGRSPPARRSWLRAPRATHAGSSSRAPSPSRARLRRPEARSRRSGRARWSASSRCSIGAPRNATVTATTDTMALEVRADAFANLVRASSPVALRFQLQVALAGVRQLRMATRKLADAVAAAPASLAPMSQGRMLDVDDWDEDDGGMKLELNRSVPSRR